LRKQFACAVRRVDDEVQAVGVINLPQHDDPLTRQRMMRVVDQHLERVFLGSMSWD
jgi:hypothetical protein